MASRVVLVLCVGVIVMATAGVAGATNDHHINHDQMMESILNNMTALWEKVQQMTSCRPHVRLHIDTIVHDGSHGHHNQGHHSHGHGHGHHNATDGHHRHGHGHEHHNATDGHHRHGHHNHGHHNATDGHHDLDQKHHESHEDSHETLHESHEDSHETLHEDSHETLHESHGDSHEKHHESHGESHEKHHESHGDSHEKHHESHGESHETLHESHGDSHEKHHESHGESHEKHHESSHLDLHDDSHDSHHDAHDSHHDAHDSHHDAHDSHHDENDDSHDSPHDAPDSHHDTHGEQHDAHDDSHASHHHSPEGHHRPHTPPHSSHEDDVTEEAHVYIHIHLDKDGRPVKHIHGPDLSHGEPNEKDGSIDVDGPAPDDGVEPSFSGANHRAKHIHTPGHDHTDHQHHNAHYTSSDGDQYAYASCFLTRNETSRSHRNVRGIIDIRQKLHGGAVEMKLNISGLDTQHTHSLHVHSLGDVSGSCALIGAPFNPNHKSSRDYPAGIRSEGDLGNLRVNKFGKSGFFKTYSYVTLVGTHSIIGRSLAIHDSAGEDTVFACCTIGRAGDARWPRVDPPSPPPAPVAPEPASAFSWFWS